MTIKAIKEKYKDYQIRGNEKNMFTVYDYNDGNGKVVIVVNSHPLVLKYISMVTLRVHGKLLPEKSIQ